MRPFTPKTGILLTICLAVILGALHGTAAGTTPGEAAALARTMAAQLPEAAEGEDYRATLLFSAGRLEGLPRGDTSASDRVGQAVAAIREIAAAMRAGSLRPGVLRGLRQWAYRSRLDGSLQPYTVYLPAGYDERRRYGLILILHGRGGDDYKAAEILADLRPDDFIIAGAYGRGDLYYYTLGEQDVLDVLDRVYRCYSVDPDRVYLTGWSMGGFGAWRLGQLFTDRFAAMAAFSGWTGQRYLPNLRNLPALIVHGSADPVVPCDDDRGAAARLMSLGCPVRYDELPGAGHDALAAWSRAHGAGALLDYFRGFCRDPWPKQVAIAAPSPRYGRGYWVSIEELAPSPHPGSLSAQVLEERTIEVRTERVTAFALDLRHPLLARDGGLTVVIDGRRLSVPAGGAKALFARAADGDWALDATEPPPHLARHNGGVNDLFYGPLTIVYGTRDPGRTPILRRLADFINQWYPAGQASSGGEPARFPVKADLALTEAELRGTNLLLLGAPAENSITARLAAGLPARFAASSVEVAGGDYPGAGVALICPNPVAPGRLIGVLTLPRDPRLLARWPADADQLLRSYYLNGYGTDDTVLPDLTVLQSFESPSQSWCFDRRWRRLSPYEP